jgi:hypothetical protein
LSSLEGDVTEISSALATVMEVLGDAEDLMSRLESAEAHAGGSAGSPAATAAGAGNGPSAWAVTADEAAWDALVDWVDGLLVTYELVDGLPACWPAHGGVVEELAALRAAWVLAATAAGAAAGAGTGDDAMSSWHDRALVPTMSRLGSSFYPIRDCRDGHRPVAAPTLTDRQVERVSPGSGAPGGTGADADGQEARSPWSAAAS